MIYSSDYLSPYGKMLIASDGTYLIGVWFYGQKYFKSNFKEKFIQNDNVDVIKKAKKWLDDYFLGLAPTPNELKIKLLGTTFQIKIWSILWQIPYGATTTYQDIGNKYLDKYQTTKIALQAVGSAISHNPIAIIIPCHRVIGKNGNLTGYAAGLKIKEALINHEKLA